MDILIYIVLLAGAVVGLWQGAFKQLAKLLGIIAGLYLAMFLYDDLGNWLANMAKVEEVYGQVVAFILIVVLVPLILGIVASILTKLFSWANINWLNRLAGAVIGVVCYAFVMSVAFNLMDFAISSAGTCPEKIHDRTELYKEVKHLSQFIVPDFIITK